METGKLARWCIGAYVMATQPAISEAPEQSLELGREQQQKLVYASLMRFGNETISLRQRALEHLVLNGLSETSEQEPLKIGQLQTTLDFARTNFRPEVLRECILRME